MVLWNKGTAEDILTVPATHVEAFVNKVIEKYYYS
jgi:hypothetical protein